MPTGSNGGRQPPTGGGPPTAAGQQSSTATPTTANNNNASRGCSRHECHNQFSMNNARRTKQPKFEGREPLLKGFIYDVTREWNPDQYIKTTKEIINYVGRTYMKYTAEFTQAVRDLELDDPTAPVNPDPVDVLAFKVWKLDIKEHQIKEQEYSNFHTGLYNVVLGQCTNALHDKLKSYTGFPKAYQDGIALLTIIIKTLMYTFEKRC